MTRLTFLTLITSITISNYRITQNAESANRFEEPGDESLE